MPKLLDREVRARPTPTTPSSRRATLSRAWFAWALAVFIAAVIAIGAYLIVEALTSGETDEVTTTSFAQATLVEPAETIAPSPVPVIPYEIDLLTQPPLPADDLAAWQQSLVDPPVVRPNGTFTMVRAGDLRTEPPLPADDFAAWLENRVPVHPDMNLPPNVML